MIVQETERLGNIYIRQLPLEAEFVQEAMRVRAAQGNSCCLFILEYCGN